MIKYRMLDNTWFYKTDGTKIWYWSFNKHKWVNSTNPWTEADTKVTKPISKSELFLKLL